MFVGMFTDMSSVSKTKGGVSSPVARKSSSPHGSTQFSPVPGTSAAVAVNDQQTHLTWSADHKKYIPSEVSSYLDYEKPDSSNPMRTQSVAVGRSSLKPIFIGRSH